MGEYFAFEWVRTAFQKRYPELAGQVVCRGTSEETAPARLTLSVGDIEVWLCRTRVDLSGTSMPCWFLTVYGQDVLGRLWDIQTPPEVLATAMYERALAETEGRPQASPWRWDEPQETLITRLADALEARGVVVEYAMAENRYRVVFGRNGYEFPRHLEQGEVLLVRVPGKRAWVFLRPGLGWLMDVHDELRRLVWRVDLGELLLQEPGTAPGLPADRVDTTALADALVPTLKGLESAEPPVVALDPGDGTPAGRADRMLPLGAAGAPVDPNRPCGVVAAQLNAFGFGDVRSSEDRAELVSEEFHIVRWRRPRPLGLPDLKKLYADASVEGRRLLVLAEHGLSGPAEEFADRSRSFVFRFDPRRARVFGGNRLAQAAMFAWS
ncbi:hypothetical protein [Nocardiopsis dassonvillei]|uniref:hypothetical protein n=1 Tax=Nocardiopsis dassonvillei TaxID=2014 RepID=UPI0012FDBBEE|nr:hypothetical protein [Nocardiopsis dassonvillei]